MADDRKTITFFQHELEMHRLERKQRRLFAAILAVSLLIIATNLAWTLAFLHHTEASREAALCAICEEYENAPGFD